MASEQWYAFQWLYTTLSNDSQLLSYATGGIWRSMAPPETQQPFVVLVYQAGNDVVSMNAFRLFDELLFQVRAVGPGTQSTTVANAAARVDTLLGGPTSGSVPGGAILNCHRYQPLVFDELVNGELWNNMGGIYRIQIEKTS